jgi:hypothetical protein
MRGAGDTRVVRPYEHLKSELEPLLAEIFEEGHELLHIMLDVGMILVGGNDAVCRPANAAVIVAILMEQDAARRLNGADATAFPETDRRIFSRKARIDEPSGEVGAHFEGVRALDDLRQGIEIWVIMRRTETELFGHRPRGRRQRLMIIVESRERSHHIGIAVEFRPFCR